MSLHWLPQRGEVKQIEFLFKLAAYGFDPCPLESSCVLAGSLHATFSPSCSQGAAMPGTRMEHCSAGDIIRPEGSSLPWASLSHRFIPSIVLASSNRVLSCSKERGYVQFERRDYGAPNKAVFINNYLSAMTLNSNSWTASALY